MKQRLRQLIGPLIVLALLVGALWLLHKELGEFHLKDFREGIAQISNSALGMAIGLTLANYIILTGYDLLGVTYIGHPIPMYKIALGGFLGYAIGNNFGTLLGGSTIRYRLYSSWGLSAVEIVRLVFFVSISFWTGFYAFASIVFLLEPLPIPPSLHLPVESTRPLGGVLVVLAGAYLLLCAVRRRPLAVGKWNFTLPPLQLAVMQYVVAALDLVAACGVLYMLLPNSVAPSYWHLLAVYLLAIVTAVVTQVPGGLGVFELVMIAMLNPSNPHVLMGSLLAYRGIYYLGPLTLGAIVMGAYELFQHRVHAKQVARVFGAWAPLVAPRIMAATVFLAGAVLLLSGATPPAAGRFEIVRRIMPLPIVEVSHFAGSLIGVFLLLLARSLQRRIETAYYVTIGLLVAGIVTSLLKGLDYEEASILAIMLTVFAPCRRHFYRQGALLSERFTFRWIVAILGVLACTTWLMLFAFKHVNYENDLWWKFEMSHDAPRSLRAMAGAVIVTLAALTSHVLRSRGQLGAMPTPQDIEDARRIVLQSPKTASHLALLGDKRFLFNSERTAFVMYREQGQSYIAMGDPVGPRAAVRELAWEFRERCDVDGRAPVFYQVDEDTVPLYVELGLTLLKIGEEASVPLTEFCLEGSSRKGLRSTRRKLTEIGCVFAIVEPPAVGEIMPRLKAISDAWLSEKSSAEKGFSLGFFKWDYMEASPIAVVRFEGRIIAFANLWFGADKEELSLDLMRYVPDAPHGVMEYLFIELMCWGKENGYRWFNLGMAPLAGVDAQPHGPLWNQIAGLTYRHGEHFYNFQGLRHYKDKFDPVWKPKYIASPGGLSLPITLTNVATLISGGLSGLLRKPTQGENS